MDGKEIIGEARRETARALDLRRALHRDPERSFDEQRTALRIGRALDGAGIAWCRVAGTGVLARIDGALPAEDGSPAVVLRADIDALPVTENTGLEYASQCPGMMHACGHDMHAGALFGALTLLAARRDRFGGRVWGLFQPGEECNPGGAQAVLAARPFAGSTVRAVIGAHVEPQLPTGSFGVRTGKYMAASDELRFRIRGKGGHAALRASLRDPVPAAAETILALHALADEYSTSEAPAILSIGRVEAAGATNVVPDEVYLEGTMRTFDEGIRSRIKERIAAEALRIGAERGVRIEPDINHGYPAVVNDAALADTMRSVVRELFGAEALHELALRPTAEDFGRYGAHFPALFYRWGVGGTPEEAAAVARGRLHTSCFAPDEEAMPCGIALLAALALRCLQ